MPTRRLWTILDRERARARRRADRARRRPKRCPPPTAAEARAAAAAAAGWLAGNQRDDGTYTYAVDGTGRDLGDYNIVRHAGVTLSLYQAARAADDDELLAAGDRGLDVDARPTRRTRRLGRARGGVGCAARRQRADARRARGAAGDDRRRPNTTTRCAASALPRVDAEGQRRLLHRVRTADRTNPIGVGISQYYAGEALWAIARLQNALPDPVFRTTAERAARFISTERDDLDFVPVGPLNDHWGSYGFAEMADWPLGDAEADYARSALRPVPALDPLGSDRRTRARRTRGRTDRSGARPRSARGSRAKAPWPASRASTTGSTTSPTSRSTARSVGRASSSHVSATPRTSATDGAWFTDDESRMDDQQHAISGLLALADLLEQEPS